MKAAVIVLGVKEWTAEVESRRSSITRSLHTYWRDSVQLHCEKNRDKMNGEGGIAGQVNLDTAVKFRFCYAMFYQSRLFRILVEAHNYS